MTLRGALRAHLIAAVAGDAAHDVAHTDRVWANAQVISDGEAPCDMTVLLAACYFHDLVTLPKDSPDRALASALSAKAAAPVLQKLGLTEKQIANACHAIIAHSFSANIPPETLEAKILQDADRIEALGAIGIARCFATTGVLGGALFHGLDPFGTARPLNDKAYAVDHFRLKLLKLPATMQTVSGRHLAEDRANVLRDFLDQLASELDVPASGW
ncbi:MAG: HD domain-containing protein [Yoonia sp.]|nr:HD domain-containing protein [Yoonia sp.]